MTLVVKPLMSDIDRESVEKLLMFEEGYRSKPYRDSLGFWTIGYGHRIPGPNNERRAQSYFQTLLGVAKNEQVTIDVVLQEILQEDIDIAIEGAGTIFGADFVLAPPSVRVALASLVFQLGATKVMGYDNTKDLIRNKQYEKLASNMSTWLLAKQAPSRTTRYQLLLRSGNMRSQFVYDMIVNFSKGVKA